jgi:hypothetical protein
MLIFGASSVVAVADACRNLCMGTNKQSALGVVRVDCVFTAYGAVLLVAESGSINQDA